MYINIIYTKNKHTCILFYFILYLSITSTSNFIEYFNFFYKTDPLYIRRKFLIC